MLDKEQVTVAIEKKIHRQLKRWAFDEERTVKELTTAILTEALERRAESENFAKRATDKGKGN